MNVTSWVGKRIGLDMSWLIGNSTWLIAGRVSRMAAGIGITLMFARFVDASIFGQYQLLISIMAIVSIITLPGFNGSLFRALACRYDGTFRAVINLSFMCGLLGVAVLISISLYMLATGSNAIATGLLASAVLFPFVYVFNRWGVIYTAKEMFRLGALYNILISFFLFFGMAIAILVFQNNAVIILITFLVINSITNIFFHIQSLKYLKNDRIERQWKSSGYKLVLSHAFGVLYTHLDKVVIGYVLGIRAVAVYVIAISLGDAVKAVLVNGIIVYKSKIFRLDDGNIRFLLSHYVLIMGALVSFLVAALWLVIPILVPLLFSNKYIESIPYAKAYLIIIPFSLMNTALSEILIKFKQEYSLFLSSVVSGSLNIVLYFTLIPYMGIMGAIVASIAFHSVEFVLRYVMVLDGLVVRENKL